MWKTIQLLADGRRFCSNAQASYGDGEQSLGNRHQKNTLNFQLLRSLAKNAED